MIEIVNGAARIVPNDGPIDIDQREAELRALRVLHVIGIEGTVHVEPYTRQRRILRRLKSAKKRTRS